MFWRQLTEGPDDQPPPHPDEICLVPIYEFSGMLRGKAAFRLAFDKKRRNHAWRRLTIHRDSIHPGDTLMLDVDLGGYSEERGWLGDDRSSAAERPKTYVARFNNRRAWVCATPGGINVVADLDERVVGYSGRNRDPRSFVRRWMTLDEHLNSAQQRAAEISDGLVRAEIKPRIVLAARWHDVGKALERRLDDGSVTCPFQKMLLAAGKAECGHPVNGVLYAKSNGRGGKGAGFRHEVASALAYLTHEGEPDDLVAYLIMCHHGKVRLLPEPWDEYRMNDTNGVRPGDLVSADGLHGLIEPGVSVQCEPARLLSSPSWPSWQRRVAGLLAAHGPFELAFLEALVRAADWRASQ